MKIPCPDCPDGYVWTREGPTGKACPRCKGHAYIGGDEDENLPDEGDWGDEIPPF